VSHGHCLYWGEENICSIYLDDIIVFLQSGKEHYHHLKNAFLK
jgi:hypothetical protein